MDTDAYAGADGDKAAAPGCTVRRRTVRKDETGRGQRGQLLTNTGNLGMKIVGEGRRGPWAPAMTLELGSQREKGAAVGALSEGQSQQSNSKGRSPEPR